MEKKFLIDNISGIIKRLPDNMINNLIHSSFDIYREHTLSDNESVEIIMTFKKGYSDVQYIVSGSTDDDKFTVHIFGTSDKPIGCYKSICTIVNKIIKHYNS